MVKHPYCGAKVMINNDNEHIYRTIDEAGIKQAETERVVRMRELELEENEKNSGNKTKYIAYGIAIVFAVVVIVLLGLGSVTAGSMSIVVGGFIAYFAYFNFFENNKKTKKYVRPDEVAVTEGMVYCTGKILTVLNSCSRGRDLQM